MQMKLNKKNLKRFVTFCMAAVMAGGMLSGCALPKSSQQANDGKVTITVGGWPIKDTEPEKHEMYQEWVKEFNEIYPDIEIIGDEFRYDVETYFPKAEAGTLPVVYPVYFTETERIMRGGYAADVSKQYKEYGYYDKTTEHVLKNITDGEGIYFIPSSMYTLGIVVNLDMLKAAGVADENGYFDAPETFDELARMAKTISEKTGEAGFLFPTTGNGGGWNFTALGWNFGVKFMEEKDGKWVSAFNSPEGVETLQWLKDLKWKYNAMPSLTLIDNNEAMKQVGTGKAAMAFANPLQVSKLPIKYDKPLDSFGYIKMPAGPKDHTTLMGGECLVVREDATPEQIDAAFKWLEFTGVTPNLNEDGKEALEGNIKQQVADNKIVGILDLKVWNEKSEYQQFYTELINKYANVDVKNLASYNDKTGLNFRVEEEKCAQELYKILDSCIQEVLTNENADCKAILDKAASDFQNNHLDYEN